MTRTALIMAAGTGGHVFPALAVAHGLQQQGFEIHWLGTPVGMEQKLVPQHGFPLHAVNIRGLRGKGLAGLLAAPWRIAKAVGQSLAVIRTIRPVVVVGFGGYIAGPGGVAARLAGIPLIIHEQNALAGMTNRLLNRISHLSLQAFPGALKNARVVGNPVREDVIRLPEPEANRDQPLRVLVVGGSLGACALNDAVLDAWQQMPSSQRPLLKHQVGARDEDRMSERYQASDVEAQVSPFIDDMAAAYNWADLLVCRAGALTVSEIAVAGKPSILVPFPYAVDDHQTVNAGFLQQQGAALIRQQRELTPEWLRQTVLELDQDRERLQQMATNARLLARPEATNDAVREIMRMARD